MSRVHDALRRAEMGGLMPAAQPPAAAEGLAADPDVHPADNLCDGAAAAATAPI
jgi:hypothetical protein